MEYHVYICSCGRLHFIPEAKFKWLDAAYNSFLLHVCTNCGNVTRIACAHTEHTSEFIFDKVENKTFPIGTLNDSQLIVSSGEPVPVMSQSTPPLCADHYEDGKWFVGNNPVVVDAEALIKRVDDEEKISSMIECSCGIDWPKYVPPVSIQLKLTAQNYIYEIDATDNTVWVMLKNGRKLATYKTVGPKVEPFEFLRNLAYADDENIFNNIFFPCSNVRMCKAFKNHLSEEDFYNIRHLFNEDSPFLTLNEIAEEATKILPHEVLSKDAANAMKYFPKRNEFDFKLYKPVYDTFVNAIQPQLKLFVQTGMPMA